MPGDVEASLLVKAVKYDDEVLHMPPKGKLPDAVDRHAWRNGSRRARSCRTRRDATHAKKQPGIDFESARSHWAYQPIRRPAIPAVHDRDWPRSPVDSFVLASLEAAGLTPSPPADRRTLIRRAYYDLTGLPPTVGGGRGV